MDSLVTYRYNGKVNPTRYLVTKENKLEQYTSEDVAQLIACLSMPQSWQYTTLVEGYQIVAQF